MQVVVAVFVARPHLLVPLMAQCATPVRKGTLPEGCRHALGRVNSGMSQSVLLSFRALATLSLRSPSSGNFTP